MVWFDRSESVESPAANMIFIGVSLIFLVIKSLPDTLKMTTVAS